MMVPSVIRISENDAGRSGPGLRVRASVSIWPDQFELWSALKMIAIVGHQRDVRDFDASSQEGKKAQARNHVLGRERRRPGAVITQDHIVEPHRTRWEQRYRGSAAKHGVEPGDGADFGLDRLAHRVGRHQKWQDHESADTDGGQGQNDEANALDINGRGHDASFSKSSPAKPG